MQNQLFFRIFIILFFVILFLYLFESHIGLSAAYLAFINTCPKSYRESDGFICESDELWNERKILYQIQDKLNLQKQPSNPYFLKNWEPNFHCSYARRIGVMGDGGKWVCDLFRLRSRPDCLVYSAGSNGDFSFEMDLKHYLPNCEIHTFDMNLYKCPKDVCIFHQAKLGNGQPASASQSWKMMVESLGHQERRIDVLKIDVEGGEFEFFPTIFQSSNRSHPQQILVEIHPKTVEGTHSLFELLRTNNYAIFNKEPNILAQATLFEPKQCEYFHLHSVHALLVLMQEGFDHFGVFVKDRQSGRVNGQYTLRRK